jgi:hypothetical protein
MSGAGVNRSHGCAPAVKSGFRRLLRLIRETRSVRSSGHVGGLHLLEDVAAPSATLRVLANHADEP